MTVQELIEELMATCHSLDDVVIVADVGLVTKLDVGKAPGTGAPAVLLNRYETSEDNSK